MTEIFITVGELIEKLEELPKDSTISGSLIYNTIKYSTANSEWMVIPNPVEIIDANELKKYIDYTLIKPDLLNYWKERKSRDEG
jgi:hypothetical protein